MRAAARGSAQRLLLLFCGLAALTTSSLAARRAQGTPQPSPPASVSTEVLPIHARGVSLPSEAESARVTKFSFIAYGDTRASADGTVVQLQHARVVDRIIGTIPAERRAGFPVRLIMQSGDAVQDGRVAAQWNVSFTPVIERLIRHTGLPFFFVVGNHDVDIGNGGRRTIDDAERRLGLRNVGNAMSELWPREGSPRRLPGYPTFAFAYGTYFFLAIDSSIAADDIQLDWVTRQLETLDRNRHPNVVVIFHHPVLTSGRHGGPLVETQSDAMRRLYLPLFRKHHVRLTVTGHDHFYDHWVEYYDDASGAHRMDHVVSGGGGAPVYVYRGEQDVEAFAETAAPQKVRAEHLIRPGSTEAENPHHFVVVEVDRDRMWLKVVSAGDEAFEPYGKQTRIELEQPVRAGGSATSPRPGRLR